MDALSVDLGTLLKRYDALKRESGAASAKIQRLEAQNAKLERDYLERLDFEVKLSEGFKDLRARAERAERERDQALAAARGVSSALPVAAAIGGPSLGEGRATAAELAGERARNLTLIEENASLRTQLDAARTAAAVAPSFLQQQQAQFAQSQSLTSDRDLRERTDLRLEVERLGRELRRALDGQAAAVQGRAKAEHELAQTQMAAKVASSHDSQHEQEIAATLAHLQGENDYLRAELEQAESSLRVMGESHASAVNEAVAATMANSSMMSGMNRSREADMATSARAARERDGLCEELQRLSAELNHTRGLLTEAERAAAAQNGQAAAAASVELLVRERDHLLGEVETMQARLVLAQQERAAAEAAAADAMDAQLNALAAERDAALSELLRARSSAPGAAAGSGAGVDRLNGDLVSLQARMLASDAQLRAGLASRDAELQRLRMTVARALSAGNAATAPATASTATATGAPATAATAAAAAAAGGEQGGLRAEEVAALAQALDDTMQRVEGMESDVAALAAERDAAVAERDALLAERDGGGSGAGWRTQLSREHTALRGAAARTADELQQSRGETADAERRVTMLAEEQAALVAELGRVRAERDDALRAVAEVRGSHAVWMVAPSPQHQQRNPGQQQQQEQQQEELQSLARERDEALALAAAWQDACGRLEQAYAEQTAAEGPRTVTRTQTVADAVAHDREAAQRMERSRELAAAASDLESVEAEYAAIIGGLEREVAVAAAALAEQNTQTQAVVAAMQGNLQSERAQAADTIEGLRHANRQLRTKLRRYVAKARAAGTVDSSVPASRSSDSGGSGDGRGRSRSERRSRLVADSLELLNAVEARERAEMSAARLSMTNASLASRSEEAALQRTVERLRAERDDLSAKQKTLLSHIEELERLNDSLADRAGVAEAKARLHPEEREGVQPEYDGRGEASAAQEARQQLAQASQALADLQMRAELLEVQLAREREAKALIKSRLGGELASLADAFAELGRRYRGLEARVARTHGQNVQ